MVGYYPQLQEGELLYSATARLAAAIFPGRSAAYCAERLLGNGQLSLGVLIPNHVDRLIENIPAITGLRREDTLRASIYNLQAPLIDAGAREKLKRSIFSGASTATNGHRNFNARGTPTALKYCVACARRDLDLGRPAYWRVLHNHPGSVACAEHGILLQVSGAPVGPNTLCDPADWIRPDAALPAIASDAELAIAKDFAWIQAHHLTVNSGFQALSARLRTGLLGQTEFIVSYGLLNTAKLGKAAKACLSISSEPMFASMIRQLDQGRCLSMRYRITLQAYGLLAYLAGTSLRQILTNIATESHDAISYENGPVGAERWVLWHKERIMNFISAHRGCSRSQICSALPHSLSVVRSQDTAWYDDHMPKPRRRKAGWQIPQLATGSRIRFGDWPARDDALCSLVSRYMSSEAAPRFRSFRDALAKLNQSRTLMMRESGRLPKFRALLQSLIVPQSKAA